MYCKRRLPTIDIHIADDDLHDQQSIPLKVRRCLLRSQSERRTLFLVVSSVSTCQDVEPGYTVGSDGKWQWEPKEALQAM